MKPEKRELARVVDERGEVEDCEAEVEGEMGVEEFGEKAVRSLRRELRGWRGWRRVDGIVRFVR